MQTLLNYTVFIEPDRQRLSHFIVEAVQMLGGNVFCVTSNLISLLDKMRDESAHNDTPLEINLILDETRIMLRWNSRYYDLVRLENLPPPENINAVVERLSYESEMADPELLKRKNERIRNDLEAAKQRAAMEMAEVEALLEKKKQELRESVRQAETDSLTGLYNRGAYDQRLNEAIMRCKRQSEPMCLIFLDMDKFKQINDTRGHQYGDECLKRLAKAMRGSCRDHVDHPCRMGGDEFAIIVFEGLRIAKIIADKILKKMNYQVSIGVTSLFPDDSDITLVSRCDAALYKAKELGRGRMVVAPEQN